jgi:hypothetical protein
MRWAVLAAALAAAILVVFYVYTGIASVLSSMSGVPEAPAPDSLTIEVPRPAVRSGRAPVPAANPGDRAQAVTPTLPAESTVSTIGDQPRASAGIGRVLRKQVADGLSEFRARLASCPDSREGRQGRQPAVLILELMSRDGGVEIVDVPREKHGWATDSFMACARDVLRGRVIPVQAAKSGTRMHLAFHLAAQ